MKLPQVIQSLEAIAPPSLAAPWDNVGLLITPLGSRGIKRILLTIDPTEAVADEAVLKKIDLVIAYHPILFRPARRLDAGNGHDRAVMKLVRKDIALYSPHTALDAVVGGVNDWLAGCIGEGEIEVLHPCGEMDAGQGRIVHLANPVALQTLAQRIRRNLGLRHVRTAKSTDGRSVRTVALCAGSGGDVLENVPADCYLTGEMGHHRVLAATQAGTHVILCEHSSTERGYLPVFAQILRRVLGVGIDILIAERDAEPIQTNR